MAMGVAKLKYIVERIEEDIASLENIETGEITNYNVSEIPFKIYEGDVLIFDEDVWSQDNEEKENINLRIKNKMENLWEEEWKRENNEEEENNWDGEFWIKDKILRPNCFSNFLVSYFKSPLISPLALAFQVELSICFNVL